MRRLTCFIVVTAFIVVAPVSAWARPDIAVDPLSHDFEDVELGATGTVSIVISNDSQIPLFLYVLAIEGVDSGSFYISDVDVSDSGWSQDPNTLPLVIWSKNGGIDPHTITLEITFEPKDLGDAEAALKIVNNDPTNGTIFVALRGTGVEPQAVDIEAILAFFDDNVEAGNIQGTGPTCAAKRAHLKVFKFKLLMAAFFIDKEWNKGACQLLGHAYDRSDGQKPPKDWIEDVEEGSGAVLALNNMLLMLMSDMGCL
jgi:hypothetical protein